MLLECSTVEVDVVDKQGAPPILLCVICSQKGQGSGSATDVLKLLVRKGADIEVIDEDGYGLIELALSFGQAKMAEFLIGEWTAKKKEGKQMSICVTDRR